MEPVTINQVGGNKSCYRLRGEPVQLRLTEWKGVRPDGDGYEQVWDESFGSQINKARVKAGISRKQRAARQMIPLATVKLVKLNEPSDYRVVDARLEGKSDDEVKIVELTLELERLRELVK